MRGSIARRAHPHQRHARPLPLLRVGPHRRRRVRPSRSRLPRPRRPRLHPPRLRPSAASVGGSSSPSWRDPPSGGSESQDDEPVDLVEDGVVRDELEAETECGGGDPPVGLVNLLPERVTPRSHRARSDAQARISSSSGWTTTTCDKDRSRPRGPQLAPARLDRSVAHLCDGDEGDQDRTVSNQLPVVAGRVRVPLSVHDGRHGHRVDDDGLRRGQRSVSACSKAAHSSSVRPSIAMSSSSGRR